MKPLEAASPDEFAKVRFVLTDMDETLTYGGRLAASTYGALERLQATGVVVIPVTAAPAGWCDQMARMWPVDAVIGENGGLLLQRRGEGVCRLYWSRTVESERDRLERLGARICRETPGAELAEDQPFRLTTLAFRAPKDLEVRYRILRLLRENGAEATENNLWILGWFGGFDKLTMARRVLSELYDFNIDLSGDQILYVGDSVNDAPMFSFFRHTVGVSTVRRYLPEIPVPPAWVTVGPGGAGFVEAAEAVLASKPCPSLGPPPG